MTLDVLVADAEAVIKDLYWYYGRRGYSSTRMDQSTVDDWASISKLLKDIEDINDVDAFGSMQDAGTKRSVSFLRSKNPQLADRLEELIALPPDWDCAEAIGPTKAAVDRAVGLLLHAEEMATPARFIAPLVDGGLQLEWGPIPKGKLVVAIDPDGAAVEYVFIDDRGARDATEGWLDRDSELDQYLSLLSL